MSGPYGPGSMQQTEIVCPRCEGSNTPNTSFCGRCGQSLAGAPVRVVGGGYQQGQQAQAYYAPPPQTDARPYYQPDQPQVQSTQGDYAMPPQPVQGQYAPYAMAQQGAVGQQAGKNVGLSLLLTILFGPLGLFYATLVGGAIMVVVGAVAVTLFFVLVVGRLNEYVDLATISGLTGVTWLAIGIWVGLVVASSIWGALAISSGKGRGGSVSGMR